MLSVTRWGTSTQTKRYAVAIVYYTITPGKGVYKACFPDTVVPLCTGKTNHITAGGEGVIGVRTINLQPHNITVSHSMFIQCPRYEASGDEETKAETVHQDQLVAEMRRDGYAFKQNVLGRSIQDETYNKVKCSFVVKHL